MPKYIQFDPDDYLKELVEPTSKYEFQGRYIFGKKEYIHVGFVTLDPNGNFVGRIYDPESMCKNNGIKGTVITEDDRTIMRFYKIPEGFPILYYQLEKVENIPGETESIEGTYKGRWVFTEAKTDINNMPSEQEFSILKTERENDSTMLMFYRSI